MMNDPIRLEVFSDYTCPWCYVGWARLEAALARLPDDLSVEVEWRPFEIHPEVPPEGMPVEDLPYPPDVWARMQDALKQAAASEGLEVGARPKVANTRRALMAGAWAQDAHPGIFPRFHERLFTAYFAEGRDLGEAAVLDELAADVGLDVEEMRTALDDGPWSAALELASADARAMGITGTPTFVLDRRFGLSGAQPAETLLEAIRSAREGSGGDSA